MNMVRIKIIYFFYNQLKYECLTFLKHPSSLKSVTRWLRTVKSNTPANIQKYRSLSCRIPRTPLSKIFTYLSPKSWKNLSWPAAGGNFLWIGTSKPFGNARFWCKNSTISTKSAKFFPPPAVETQIGSLYFDLSVQFHVSETPPFETKSGLTRGVSDLPGQMSKIFSPVALVHVWEVKCLHFRQYSDFGAPQARKFWQVTPLA